MRRYTATFRVTNQLAGIEMAVRSRSQMHRIIEFVRHEFLICTRLEHVNFRRWDIDPETGEAMFELEGTADDLRNAELWIRGFSEGLKYSNAFLSPAVI